MQKFNHIKCKQKINLSFFNNFLYALSLAIALMFGGTAYAQTHNLEKCDLTQLQAKRLEANASAGFNMLLMDGHELTLPSAPFGIVAGLDMTVVRYEGDKYVSYMYYSHKIKEQQAIELKALNMSELNRKIYGIDPLNKDEYEQLNIEGLRAMSNITCAVPNFNKYLLQDGAIAIVQPYSASFSNMNYIRVLVFMEKDKTATHHFDFKNYTEAEVTRVMSTWQNRDRK